jgi:SAM-dependent methyltransferase
MWNDIVELRDFYDRSLGQEAQRLIRQRLRALWPSVVGHNVLGLGYATPFLRPFMEEAERVIAIMPAAQGVLRWPGPHRADGQRNRVALADETSLPLPDRSMDRVLLVHALECTEQMRPMLREIWRVLAEGGRLLIVVPNRRGIWARLDITPFGQGNPYSIAQISRLLRDNMFTPTGWSHALFAPPFRSRMLMASAPAWEQIGRRWFSVFGGVLLIEAQKQVYAATTVPAFKRRRLYVPVPAPSLGTPRPA